MSSFLTSWRKHLPHTLLGTLVLSFGLFSAITLHLQPIPMVEASSPAASFQLSSPSNRVLTINRGTSAYATIRLQRLASYKGRPPLRVEGLPDGVTATLTPTLLNTASILRIRTNAQSPLGFFPFRIVAVDGSISSSLHFSLNVQTPATSSFSLWSNANLFSLHQGGSVFIPLTVSRWKTMEDITITVLQAPNGLTTSPLMITAGNRRGSLLLQADASLAPGTYSVIVNADSAKARRTLPLTIRVIKNANPVAPSIPTPLPTPSPSPTPTPSLPPITPPTPTPSPTPTQNGQAFDIGNVTVRDIWVDPVHGNDDNDGNTRASALQHIYTAWRRIPSGTLTGTGYRIQLVSGLYPENHLPNYWEEKQGTNQFPIIIQAADGRGTATFQGDMNVYHVNHLYLIDFNIIPSPPGDTFHCERCDTVLMRGMKLDGGNRSAHETVKVNQSQHLYIEDSDISGAWDNAIDFVAVQYGHILRNKISNAEDWCMYVKGGSAYIHIEGNEIFNCGTGGFTAGQGTGAEFMEAPWIHYEAYGIAFVNNVIHDTLTAGMGVSGGYNVLFAYNTLVRAGTRDHFFEANFGGHGCDGDRAACSAREAAGGWASPNGGIYIPNKNVYVFNNLFYASRENDVPYLFQIGTPIDMASGNLSGTQYTDTNLQIRGNVIWDGDVDDIGVSPTRGGCADSNPTCNIARIQTDNTIGGREPAFANLNGNDFHLTDTALNNLPTFSWPDFDWSALPTRPLAPAGVTHIDVLTNKDGNARPSRAGAY